MMATRAGRGLAIARLTGTMTARRSTAMGGRDGPRASPGAVGRRSPRIATTSVTPCPEIHLEGHARSLTHPVGLGAVAWVATSEEEAGVEDADGETTAVTEAGIAT